MQSEIMNLEEELRLAMLTSDVAKLDKLIDDSLVFISPDGSIATKQMDLIAHKNKIQKLTKMVTSEQNIQINDNIAIVDVKMDLTGSFADSDISGQFRYLRIWQHKNDEWKIIAGSVSKIQG